MTAPSRDRNPSTEGSCLCGGVRLRVHGALPGIQVCHCRQCRKAQGGPLATNLPVRRADVEFLAGLALIQRYQSSAGKWRCFCRACGSPLYSERDALPDRLRLRAGLLDGPLPAGVALHQQIASACDWWPLPVDGLPAYPGAPPPS